MRYKTISLELLKQRPPLHEQLRQERTLLTAMETLALRLKSRHEAWKEQLAQAKPGVAVGRGEFRGPAADAESCLRLAARVTACQHLMLVSPPRPHDRLGAAASESRGAS